MTTAEQQRADALELANHVRISNARFKETIAALPEPQGRHRVADLLDGPTDGAHGQLKINQLLKAIDRVGDRGLFEMLRHAGVLNPEKRLRELTPRQRKALVDVLRDKRVLYPSSRVAA